MTRRRERVRHLGGVVVSVGRDEQGRARGSVLELDGRRWTIDAWPDRIATVEPLAGALVVHLHNGASRLLEARDAA